MNVCEHFIDWVAPFMPSKTIAALQADHIRSPYTFSLRGANTGPRMTQRAANAAKSLLGPATIRLRPRLSRQPRRMGAANGSDSETVNQGFLAIWRLSSPCAEFTRVVLPGANHNHTKNLASVVAAARSQGDVPCMHYHGSRPRQHALRSNPAT